jgi:hypothetical protein
VEGHSAFIISGQWHFSQQGCLSAQKLNLETSCAAVVVWTFSINSAIVFASFVIPYPFSYAINLTCAISAGIRRDA